MSLTAAGATALAAGISATASTAASAANQFKKMSRAKEFANHQADLNEKAAQKNYDRQMAAWNMENEYNSPQSQLARYREAGMNPNLAYSQGNSGNASAAPQYNEEPAQYEGHSPDLTQLVPNLSNYMGILQQAANIKKTQQDTAYTKTLEQNAILDSFAKQSTNNYIDDFLSNRNQQAKINLDNLALRNDVDNRTLLQKNLAELGLAKEQYYGKQFENSLQYKWADKQIGLQFKRDTNLFSHELLNYQNSVKYDAENRALQLQSLRLNNALREQDGIGRTIDNDERRNIYSKYSKFGPLGQIVGLLGLPFYDAGLTYGNGAYYKDGHFITGKKY